MATLSYNETQGALKAKMETYGEGHVFQYATDGLELHTLCSQLSAVDMDRQKELYQKVICAAESGSRFEGATIEAVNNPNALTSTEEETKTLWYDNYYTALSQGKLALLILAGGAGTRLGFNGPKGKFRVNSPSNKSLFQFHSERVRKLELLTKAKKNVDVRIPVYIMTSPQNNDETVLFFEENNYFGLDSSCVTFFAQGTLPCFSNDGGKLMMESPSKLAVAADGNGGLYPAMYNNGILDDLKNRGVDYIHTICIDNILVRALDPAFMGLVVTSKAEVGSLTVKKRAWQEPIGMLVKLNGKYAIAEYSDVDDKMKQETTNDGKLKFEQGNICIHAFSTQFLIEKVVPQYVKKIVPANYHIARKQIPVYNTETKETVKPKEKNGIKLEMFIFDVFDFAESMAILQVPREEQFSPVKNKEGPGVKDSPGTAREMLSNLHKEWLVAAGATINGDGLVEVSPLVSYNGEGLESFAGKTLQTPCLIQEKAQTDPNVYFVDSSM